ncbi:MAG: hypothetical protein ACXVIA_05425 [Halobacteriota archaeon]
MARGILAAFKGTITPLRLPTWYLYDVPYIKEVLADRDETGCNLA